MAELELYSIPTRASWFEWDAIHDIERRALPEFFNNTSLSKTPKVYKQYRDFIISKYREDPSRRLPFTHVRRSLLGDVSALFAVFRFLDDWGLINFAAVDGPSPSAGRDRVRVVVEDGQIPGLRVAEFPNSTKVLSSVPAPTLAPDSSGVSGSGFRVPPLASYSDAFFPLLPDVVACRICRDNCESDYYSSEKDGFIICVRCFQDKRYGENKSAADYLLKHSNEEGINHRSAPWTDSETMILLDAVVKFGDDWNAVVQQVEDRSKIDCIARLLELPFSENMLVPSEYKVFNGGDKPVEMPLGEPQDDTETVSSNPKDKNHGRLSADEDAALHPVKRKRVTFFSDVDNPLIKQSARLCALVGPNVAAAAAEAAISALCDENPNAKEILDAIEDGMTEKDSTDLSSELPRVMPSPNNTDKIHDDSEMPHSSFGSVSASSILKLRATVATSLGAAAANAKLLADQEEREIEHLFAVMLEAQMKKVQYKVKYCKDLESILEKEYEQIQQVKEFVLGERIDVLRKRMSKWGDNIFPKPFMSNTVLSISDN